MKIKLTDRRGFTMNATEWGAGVKHGPLLGRGPLCTDRWLHYYEGLGLAMLRNTRDANIFLPRVWECKPSGKTKRHRLKCGAVSLTTVRELDVTPPTAEQLVMCALVLVLETDNVTDPAWVEWAVGWLGGDARSREAVPPADGGNYAIRAANNAASTYMDGIDYFVIAAFAAAAADFVAGDGHNCSAAVAAEINAVAEAIFGY